MRHGGFNIHFYLCLFASASKWGFDLMGLVSVFTSWFVLLQVIFFNKKFNIKLAPHHLKLSYDIIIPLAT